MPIQFQIQLEPWLMHSLMNKQLLMDVECHLLL